VVLLLGDLLEDVGLLADPGIKIFESTAGYVY